MPEKKSPCNVFDKDHRKPPPDGFIHDKSISQIQLLSQDDMIRHLNASEIVIQEFGGHLEKKIALNDSIIIFPSKILPYQKITIYKAICDMLYHLISINKREDVSLLLTALMLIAGFHDMSDAEIYFFRTYASSVDISKIDSIKPGERIDHLNRWEMVQKAVKPYEEKCQKEYDIYNNFAWYYSSEAHISNFDYMLLLNRLVQ